MLDAINGINQSPIRLSAQELYTQQSRFTVSAEKDPFDNLRHPEKEQKDIVTFSDEALAKAYESMGIEDPDTEATVDQPTMESAFEKAAQENAVDQGMETGETQETDPFESELSEEEQAEVKELKSRDREVRAHEQAHISAGGSLVRSGASFEYQIGPDGQRYAIGGEVSIDVSEGRTPEETITKAGRIKRAALAPAEPSSTDRAVAAEAAAMANRARQELNQQKMQETSQQPGPVNNFATSGGYQPLNILI